MTGTSRPVAPARPPARRAPPRRRRAPRRDPETQVQIQVIEARDKYLKAPPTRIIYPEVFLLHHIANGIPVGPRLGALLVRMGVRGGMPDLHLPVARQLGDGILYIGFYVEMKAPNGRLDPLQLLIQEMLEEEGHLTYVECDPHRAWGAILRYLAGAITPAECHASARRFWPAGWVPTARRHPTDPVTQGTRLGAMLAAVQAREAELETADAAGEDSL